MYFVSSSIALQVTQHNYHKHVFWTDNFSFLCVRNCDSNTALILNQVKWINMNYYKFTSKLMKVWNAIIQAWFTVFLQKIPLKNIFNSTYSCVNLNADKQVYTWKYILKINILKQKRNCACLTRVILVINLHVYTIWSIPVTL